MTVTANNPVLRGFNPDPTIVEVDGWYYLATSTFEWYPGVRLHRSRDLVNWETIGHALVASSGFDLTGIPDSGGVWAPSLSYADGRFWLAYSIARSMDGEDKDIDNYLVTAEDVRGPWSAPVPLGSRGIDFSFFHDEGRHWLVGVRWDHRPGRPPFGGILLEEYLADEQRTTGKPIVVYRQDELVEGPNLYRFGDWYYLLLAEGGTGWNHGITAARSRTIEGPYERDAAPFVLSRRDLVGHELQKAGHGELVQLPDRSWAVMHLASRPVIEGGARYCTLGRETCVQRIVFDDDGWPRLAGGPHGQVQVDLPGDAHPLPQLPPRDDFDSPALDATRWSAVRTPAPADLDARPGWLRLRGGHSSATLGVQSMVAQRITEPNATIECLIDAEPWTFRQAAGLILWYDRNAWIWLQVTWDEENGRHARIVEREASTTRASEAFPLPAGPVRLGARLEGPRVSFRTSAADGPWTVLDGRWDAWKLSDDWGDRLRFTGMFAGVRVDDLDDDGFIADTDYIDAVFTQEHKG